MVIKNVSGATQQIPIVFFFHKLPKGGGPCPCVVMVDKCCLLSWEVTSAVL
jgi:hypothetical protein